MRSLKTYIRSQYKLLLVVPINLGIAVLTYSLYETPKGAIRYTMILTTFLWAVFIAYDFFKYIEKHHHMGRLIKDAPHRTAFLEPSIGIEGDYIDVVNVLIDEKNRMSDKYTASQAEMLDYYSLWVHQIKTPISALDLMLQTRTDADKSAMQLELFKIEQYVAMALGYLRVDSEASDFVFKPVSVLACAKSAVKKYRKVFIEKRLSLELSIEPETTVVTDEKWLTFVIEQLLSNALKYTDRGTVSLSFGCGQLIVEDTGCGIKPEDLPRVFDRGFTGYNGRLSQKSTGIGLYLTKKILRKLSMGIDIQSKVGEGTRVIILTSM